MKEKWFQFIILFVISLIVRRTDFYSILEKK